MKQFIKTHQDWILIASAVVLVGTIVWFFIWGVALIAENVGNAIVPPQGNVAATQFNIDMAQQLNLP